MLQGTWWVFTMICIASMDNCCSPLHMDIGPQSKPHKSASQFKFLVSVSSLHLNRAFFFNPDPNDDEVFGTQPHDKPTDQMYKINTILLGNNIQNHSILLAERFY
ncbi:unnamed protein product [Fusarium graminearum]|uniref:Chromosome 3, complete genome n=1 Tax=Gibberella zeae (strain ATCC MYA-4620 / CBS 123657 / FGSC 9075 / NRRL 31084 / PH-1) TaxID=229533 RepID=A0A098DZ06_GIBZE|nr:unnamed protein product [Fusarium graminearum]CZS85255.1 unnamed protein product [Fusarium graminearum]